ncbi:MAG: ribonuclease P protein component [Bacteroidales bacterium]|nr:ribonuclease P protein component [Bacteroidales bacterium]
MFDLPKDERISSDKTIDSLFTDGDSCFKYPLRVVFKPRVEASASTSRMLISVPKKRFKHAVDRNRIKRQVREAYRQNKSLLTMKESGADIAFVYVSSEHYPQTRIEGAVVSALKEIDKKLNNTRE